MGDVVHLVSLLRAAAGRGDALSGAETLDWRQLLGNAADEIERLRRAIVEEQRSADRSE